jgi:histidinol-phosphate aminotransferase
MNSDMTQGVSRRSFLRIVGAASAAATSFPAFAAMTPAAVPAGQTARRGSRGMQPLSADTVVISSNENPLGPAQSALTAICSMGVQGGRYHWDEYVKTIDVFNGEFGLKKDYSALFPDRVDRWIWR